MPFPLLVILIAAVLGSVATVALWDSIVSAWKGRRLAILGAESSGKTVLIAFLTNGVISDHYVGTKSTVSTRANRYRLADLELNIRTSHDVPGLKLAVDQWLPVVRNADIVVYLVRAHLLLKEDDYILKRLASDMKLLQSCKESRKQACFIIGTWADQIQGYRDFDEEGLAALRRRFDEHPGIQQAALVLRTLSPKVAVIIGSLEQTADREKLALSLLQTLT